MTWLDKPEDLAEAMAIIPLAEAWARAVKAVVKQKLEEDPSAVAGYKLRPSGNMTTYEAVAVAKILMDSNLIQWEDLMQAMRFNETNMVTVWADKLGLKKSEARADIRGRLKDVARSKPKSPSIVRDHG